MNDKNNAIKLAVSDLPPVSVTLNQKEYLEKPPDKVGTVVSARFCMAYMGFLGFVSIYALRVNLNVAILSMVNSSYLEPSQNNNTECSAHRTHSNQTTGEFNWDGDARGLVLGAFYYGYIATQVPGGYLAVRYGGKMLFGCGVLCTAVLSLIIPVAAQTNFAFFIAVRVLQGLTEGFTYPAIVALLGAWSPPAERSRLMAIVFSGPSFGIVIAQPISGLLCASDIMGGWPSVFYIFGLVAIGWCCLWFLIASNYPRDFKWISQEELIYIESNIQLVVPSSYVPWKKIFSSKPVWAIFCASFCGNWSLYTLLTGLPLYLKEVLNYDVAQDGFLSALPSLVTWISVNLSSLAADILRGKGILSTGQTRKMFTVIAFVGSAAFITASGYIGCDNLLVVSFICIGTMFGGCVISGWSANQLDIASRYTGILSGVANTLGTIPGFVCPIIIGYLTGASPDRFHWLYVFYISAGISVLGAIIYVLLASGLEQDWNRIEKTSAEERRGLVVGGQLACEADLSDACS